ncbi:MAG TPA: ABC transporter permease [Gammaproteobacteria bacterium]|nr:ABC transporter permease [Gammaproteobacteria bacterium]
MRTLLTVFGKEVLENLRDRRTLLSALLFGPLFGPILFASLIGFMLSETVAELDEKLELPILGAERAPNLVAWLRAHQVEVRSAPGDLAAVKAAVKDGEHSVALVIPEGFGEAWMAGSPARLSLVSDSSSSRVAKDVSRARDLLEAYGEQTGLLRLQARGVDWTLVRPIALESLDVSTPAGRSVLVLGMMTYFVLFATLLGGMYLAIDTTAGERERGSLEPLLTLPAPRGSLIAGKILATCFYMTVSLGLTLLAFAVSLSFVPLEELGMVANFGPAVALLAFAVLLPFVPLGAALMTVVASFTRSYKEAQTWLSFVLLVPTLPIIVAAVFTLKPTLALMAVPSLSQHLLVTDLLKNEPLEPLWLATSAASTLLLGAVLGWAAARLYRREAILG